MICKSYEKYLPLKKINNCDITTCNKKIFQIWKTEKRKNALGLIMDPESLISAIKLIISH